MKIIDDSLLDEVSVKAKASPRLRMNYNFHQSLDELCHRFLNALEPGTVVPVHHHVTKDETFILLKGRVKVLTYNDEGEILDEVILCREEGRYGVDIPKNTWHTLEAIESSVIFEVKQGPFVEHEVDGILDIHTRE